MLENIIESVLLGKLDSVLVIKWLNNESIEDAPEDCILLCCNRNEFVTYFLSYLRSQTDGILQSNTTALQVLQHQATPERSLSASRKHHRSISDPTSETDRHNDSLTVKTDRHRSHESPNRDRKKVGRKVKTKLFSDEMKDKSKDNSLSSDESRLSTGVDRLAITSTPLKNSKFSDYPALPLSSPVTTHSRSFNSERCDTPRLNRHSRSQDKSVSLGDYLATAQTKSVKKKRQSKNASNEDIETKVELDISNSEAFPEIGARKASSLRSERRRIKPTTIDKTVSQKSCSLNSFNSDAFQQPSPLAFEENLAFRPKIQAKESSNNFDAERNILKQERHKLMEKFNILSTSNTSKLVTPQIKISKKDTTEKELTYVSVDVTKILFKEKIDILVDIYDVLIKNNLILSMNTEIYFLISILLSKQSEDDYTCIESELNNNNITSYLLKSIHNSTYFAIRALWNERVVLEVILDKNSLKTLGENKKVRNFSPDLAKFLLNAYGLKCEAETNGLRPKVAETRTSNGIVCFNFETDNHENFASAMSFQNFRKQRDMFYEILRWYHESEGASRSSFRARVKTLLAAGPTASNHAHLAALFTAHMLAECLVITAHESKLSKLQRRLTCPKAPESHRLQRFTSKELFYKEFIQHADHECFRVHLRDALASEIVALDATPIGTDGSNTTVASQDYLQLCKKLCLLAKFLGLLASLPYTLQQDLVKAGVITQRDTFAPPKERVLENNIALRNYSQPTIDLQGLLTSSYQNERLCVTLPWIIHYLSTIDYTSLRLKYYQRLIDKLFYIYNDLKLTNNRYKKNTVIFLKSILSWLFELPHFPHEMFYESSSIDMSVVAQNIDSCDLIDESMLFELCPFLKDLTVLLSTSRVSQEQKDMGSFRHITPVSLGVNPEDRIRSKEKELQARLEEEFLKSQGASTRRVLELVVERVAAAAARHLAATVLPDARARARAKAVILVRTADRTSLLQSLETMYSTELETLHTEAWECGKACVKSRVGAALGALLPAAGAPLRALATARAFNTLARWLQAHVNRAVLCKDIEEEMKALLAVAEAPPPARAPPAQLTSPNADCTSPAAALIALKELICQLLDEQVPTADSNLVLSMCAACCSPNNLFCRPPTQRAILRLTVDYCVVYVSKKPAEVTETFLNRLHTIWNTCCPERKRTSPEEIVPPSYDTDRAPTPQSDDEGPTGPVVFEEGKAPDQQQQQQQQQKPEPEPTDDHLDVFERILCPRNIVLLSDTTQPPGAVWAAMATVLVFLLAHDYLSEDALTEQCLAVYRQDWPQNILENLSVCMKSVSSRWNGASTGKFTLFLDFLAEYCGDMDFEPDID